MTIEDVGPRNGPTYGTYNMVLKANENLRMVRRDGILNEITQKLEPQIPLSSPFKINPQNISPGF